MDQEKIGNFIKKIRKENNLSQQAFAERIGVSPQAVSKWENGKNLPDISTLKEIKKEFNVDIDSIIDGDNKKRKTKHKSYIFIIGILIFLLLVILIIKLTNKDNNFEFNELNSTNNDFSISGSVVMTSDRTSLIINSVDYTGDDDKTIYEKLTCTLYEEENDTTTKVSSCDDGENITLLEYIKGLKLRMDHETTSCTMFKTSNIFIEITAKDENNKTLSYKIPIEISNEDCN
jgi:transcriptional regulator with XRE-family HTH domain